MQYVAALILLTSSLHLQWTLSTDPEPFWFPDLMCHPGAHWDVVDNINRVPKVRPGARYSLGVRYWRNRSAECNETMGFTRDNITGCLKYCVLNKLGFFFNKKPNTMFYIPHIGTLIHNISTDWTYTKPLTNKVNRVCRYLKHPGAEDDCSTTPDIVPCVESYLNCSLSWKDYFIVKFKYWDISCHPKFDREKNLEENPEIYAGEYWCPHQYKDDDICTMACALGKHFTFWRGMNAYLVAGKPLDGDISMNVPDEEKDKKYAISVITKSLPGFNKSLVEHYNRFDTWQVEGRDIATKLAENCAQYWEVIRAKDAWKKCPEKRDEFKPLVECVRDVFACKM